MVRLTPLCRPSNTTMMQGEAFKTNTPSQCKRCPLHQAFSEDSRPRIKRNCEDDRKGWVINGFSHGIIGSYNASSSFNSNAGQHFCHQPTRATCSHWEQSSRKWGESSARRPDYVMVPRVMRAETVWLSTSLPGRSWWTAPLCWLSLPAEFHSKPHIMATSRAGAMEPRHDLLTPT